MIGMEKGSQRCWGLFSHHFCYCLVLKLEMETRSSFVQKFRQDLFDQKAKLLEHWRLIRRCYVVTLVVSAFQSAMPVVLWLQGAPMPLVILTATLAGLTYCYSVRRLDQKLVKTKQSIAEANNLLSRVDVLLAARKDRDVDDGTGTTEG